MAVAAGAAGMIGPMRQAAAQQIPGDGFVYQQGDDSSSSPAFNTSSTWSSGVAPAAGNNYIDDGWRIRTPPITSSGANAITFAGSTLTLISPNPSPYLAYPQYGIGSINVGTSGAYGYLTFKGNGATNLTTINNLILANGGVVINYGNDNQQLYGNIYLEPAGTTLNTDNSGDTITTTVSGGIIDTHGVNLSGTNGPEDNYTIVASNISGGGMLRIENSGGGTIGSEFVPQVVVLSGSNTFSGGLILDGTSTAGVTGNGPDLAIDSPTALGTGTFSILDTTSFPNVGAPGVEFDNLTGATEVLTTNNPQSWYQSFTFGGTNSLNMGAGAITLQGNIQVTVSANSLILGGPVTGGYGLTLNGGGTLALNGTLSYTGPTNVSAGVLQLGGSGSDLSGGLVIGASASTALTANHKILTTASISLAGSTGAWTGKLDIGNNAVDVQNGSLATITNQAAQGYSNGTWQNSGGITSSAAAADTTHLTAVGVIVNNVNGNALYGNGAPLGLFSGTSPGTNDVLIKYTYYGDANLDGKVDGSDYSLIDNGYLNQLTGWYNGDFNYDGVIDGSDYTLIDNSYNTQGASLAALVSAQVTAEIASPGVASAVPEPASMGIMSFLALRLLGPRRRRV